METAVFQTFLTNPPLSAWPPIEAVTSSLRTADPAEAEILSALADITARTVLVDTPVSADPVEWVGKARQVYDYLREIHKALSLSVVERYHGIEDDTAAIIQGAFSPDSTSLQTLIRVAAENDKLAANMIALQLHRLECVQLEATAVFRRIILEHVTVVDECYVSHCFEGILTRVRDQCGRLLWSVVFGPAVVDVATVTLCLDFLRMRGRRIFDIVREFPEARVAVEEMAVCMGYLSDKDRASMKVFLSDQIISQYKKRLLHAGARTHDILEVHVATMWLVSTLRLPRDCVDPVVRYFANRKDGLEVVVKCLMNPEEISSADMKAYASLHKRSGVALESDDEEGGIDVVKTLLVSFGVEAVVTQYSKMLRDALLVAPFAAFDRETKAVETLKVILGDEAMQLCSVMINDVSASRRFNQAVNESLAKVTPKERPLQPQASVLVVSKTCWPTILADPVAVHPSLSNALEHYAKAYSRLKPNRTLNWHTQNGTVELTVSINGNQRDVTLTFAQASVVLYVREKQRSLNELSELLKMGIEKIESIVNSLVPSLVQKSDNIITIQQKDPTGSGAVPVAAAVVLASPHLEGLGEEEVKMIENSVLAMLKAAGATKNIMQIENTLRMFGVLKGNAEGWKGLLAGMVAADKIVFKGGLYSLKR